MMTASRTDSGTMFFGSGGLFETGNNYQHTASLYRASADPEVKRCMLCWRDYNVLSSIGMLQCRVHPLPMNVDKDGARYPRYHYECCGATDVAHCSVHREVVTPPGCHRIDHVADAAELQHVLAKPISAFDGATAHVRMRGALVHRASVHSTLDDANDARRRTAHVIRIKSMQQMNDAPFIDVAACNTPETYHAHLVPALLSSSSSSPSAASGRATSRLVQIDMNTEYRVMLEKRGQLRSVEQMIAKVYNNGTPGFDDRMRQTKHLYRYDARTGAQDLGGDRNDENVSEADFIDAVDASEASSFVPFYLVRRIEHQPYADKIREVQSNKPCSSVYK